jgi:short-subunit dehydrogenase
MSTPKRTVLITGCSDGGLGAALAAEFHKRGLHVYATARNPAKMEKLRALGIETLTLDVLSEESIKECVRQVPSLDILVNNAGAGYSMPIADISIAEAKKLFDLNVWSYLSVTQAFLPLLLKSKGTIVHNTSIASVTTIPFQGTYHASKAAIASFADAQRLELEPFGVKVIDLKTGAVKTNFFANNTSKADSSDVPRLPQGSIYEPAKTKVERTMNGTDFDDVMIKADVWAKQVVGDLLKKSPPTQVWHGGSATIARIALLLPRSIIDSIMKSKTGVTELAKILAKRRN